MFDLWKFAFLFSIFRLLPITGASCPSDFAALRSDFVATSFNESMMMGFWYEVAYQDLAQIGEKCQNYNKTSGKQDGKSGVSEEFGFQYTSKARKMPLFYEHTSTPAVYLKHLGKPQNSGGLEDDAWSGMSSIPTVVVDATVAPANEAQERYEVLIEYMCSDVGVRDGSKALQYTEIRVGSRTPTLSKESLEAVDASLNAAGIQHRSLKTVAQDNC